MAESSSAPPNGDKPIFVRVKRKAFQSPLDAFWLEIHERPLKRPLLDFEKLSISGASSSRELKTKKILVQHVETVARSKDSFRVLRSFVVSDLFDNLLNVEQPNSSSELKSEEKNEERRPSLKTVNKQYQLLVKAKERQEVLSRHARFEQIWRSRKAKKEAPEEDAIYDMCRLYDVGRVDVGEHAVEVQNDKKDADLDDCRMLAEYLPLLREVLPTAAEEIEHDIQSKKEGYVYDIYAVKEDVHEMEVDSASQFPLVQVEDNDDYYDGPDGIEYESDDSNAENNPLNDYPNEEISEDEDEVMSRASDEKSEGESRTSESQSEELESESQVSYEDLEMYDWSDNANQFSEDELYSEQDDDAF